MRDQMKKIVAKAICRVADKAVKDAVGKKLVYVVYEPQMPEAVKKLADRK